MYKDIAMHFDRLSLEASSSMHDSCSFQFQRKHPAGATKCIEIKALDLLNSPTGFTGQSLVSAALKKETAERKGVFRFSELEFKKIKSKEARLVYEIVDGPKWHGDGDELKAMQQESLLDLFGPSQHCIVFEVALEELDKNEVIDIDMV